MTKESIASPRVVQEDARTERVAKGNAPAVILFGSPGSGKGTQAKLLKNALGIPHISTGDMLRNHIEAGDEIGRQIRQLMKSGKLVSDDLVNRLVEIRLAQPDCRSGVILDGYPRTLNQAKVSLRLLEGRNFRPAVVHLVVDYERIVARLSGRRQCPVCGTLYSLTTNPPKVAGICDLDGATLVTREDDRESVIRERLNQYDLQTRPLLEYFRQTGVPVFEIEGAGATPEQIMQKVLESLSSIGLMAAAELAAEPVPGT
ncbi:MAG TPA: nucleoside monophosphate kinase [Bryobacteraceae bacterium]|nr:nucleoside monophosphate kinase [Bryobacteraceae bacterium]